MSLKYLVSNLKLISSEPADVTLLSSDGVHIPSHHYLLSAVSPYLACLLAQAGQGGRLAISLPFHSQVVRRVIKTLLAVEEEGDRIETEGILAASRVGQKNQKLFKVFQQVSYVRVICIRTSET